MVSPNSELLQSDQRYCDSKRFRDIILSNVQRNFRGLERHVGFRTCRRRGRGCVVIDGGASATHATTRSRIAAGKFGLSVRRPIMQTSNKMYLLFGNSFIILRIQHQRSSTEALLESLCAVPFRAAAVIGVEVYFCKLG